MAERAVDLPKPHPDDDEDVVDWLSTARALWARGERHDALVWLRRAAEAAAMAGQPFRASEIGMYVTALEETFGDVPAAPAKPPPAVGEIRRDIQDTLVDQNEAFGALASEVLRSKLLSIEVDIDDTLIDETPGALLAEQSKAKQAAPPKAPPPISKQPPPPPSREPQPPREAHEAKIIVQVASVPPPAFGATPASAPPATRANPSVPPPAFAPSPVNVRPLSTPPPSFTPPLAAPRTPEGEEITLVSGGLRTAALTPPTGLVLPPGASPLASTPMPSAVRASPSGMPPPPPSFGLPPLNVPPPPPTPTGDGFPGVRAQRREAPVPKPPKPSSAPPPPPSPSSRPAASSVQPPSSDVGSAPPPPRPPMPSSLGGAVSSAGQSRVPSRRPGPRAPRQPILDPWADDQAAPPLIARPVPKSGQEEVVVFRARLPSIHDEEEVFTSAAPLPPSLRRNPPSGAGVSMEPASPPPVLKPEPVVASEADAPASPATPPQPGRLRNVADVAAKPLPPPSAVASPEPEPVEIAVPAKAAAEAAVAKVPSEQAPTKAAVEKAPSEDAPAKAAVEKAPSEDAPAKAAAEAAVVKVPSEQAPTKAAVEHAAAKAPSEQAPAKAAVEHATAKAPSEQAPAKAAVEAAPAVEGAARESDWDMSVPGDEPATKPVAPAPIAPSEPATKAADTAPRRAALLPRTPGAAAIPRPVVKASVPPPGATPSAKAAAPSSVAPPAKGATPSSAPGALAASSSASGPSAPKAAFPSVPAPKASAPAASTKSPASRPPGPLHDVPSAPSTRPSALVPAPAAASPPESHGAPAAQPEAVSPAPVHAAAPRPATVPPAPMHAAAPRPATVPPAPMHAAAPRPATVPPPPPVMASVEPEGSANGHEDNPHPGTFDSSRATLPMMLEIEPPARPVEMASMRATMPMALELPKEVEAFFAARGDTSVRLEGVRLGDVDIFEGMPRAVHEGLVSTAEIVQLGPDEEVRGFGAALLLSGMAVLCATIVDAPAHWARPGELLVSRGSLRDGIAVRVVGQGDGAQVAVWPRAALEEALAAHAGAETRARARGDRLQALAGATMGPFGEIDDEDRRALAMDLGVKCLRPGEVWLEDSAPVPAIALVGAGEMELYGPISEETSETVAPGSLVFPELAMAGGEAPSSARAGAQGALLLVVESDVAQRMLARVPDLAERLRG